jgi:metal-sulfur cluster biosynthetic enzyme
MNMVHRIALEGEERDRVFVELLMGETEEMFYENIEEEAREHLEELEGVSGVTVKLSERKLLDE